MHEDRTKGRDMQKIETEPKPLRQGLRLHKEPTSVPEELFDLIWCPICGNTTFVEQRFDKVFCMGCGTGVSAYWWRREDDGGIIHVCFDVGYKEYKPPDGEERMPPGKQVLLEVEVLGVGFRMKGWDPGEPEWEPMSPRRAVTKNPHESAVPWRRWG